MMEVVLRVVTKSEFVTRLTIHTADHRSCGAAVGDLETDCELCFYILDSVERLLAQQ